MKLFFGKARSPHGHRAGLQTGNITGKTRDHDKLQKNGMNRRGAAGNETKVNTREDGTLLRSRQKPDFRRRLDDDLRLRHIQSGSLRQSGNQTVMLGLSSVVVEAVVKFLGGGEPEQREPETQHQRRDSRLGEAADAVECGFSAQCIEMKPDVDSPRKENLRHESELP